MHDTMSRRRPPAPEDPKVAALRAAGALHPRPEAVQDEAFARQEFFDRRDRVQVKYEMLRRHRVDGTAGDRGGDRVRGQPPGLLCRRDGLHGGRAARACSRARAGRKRAHKCTDDILDFVEQQRAETPGRSAAAMADAVREHFGVAVHPRSLARALVRRKKNGAARTPRRR